MKLLSMIRLTVIGCLLAGIQLIAQEWEPVSGKDQIYINPTSTKVGIGLTNPSEALEIGEAGNLLMSAGESSPTTAGKLYFTTENGTQSGKIWAAAIQGGENSIAEGLFFSGKGSTAEMTLDENGYLGIGTDSPIGRLHIKQQTGHMETLLINAENWHNYIRISNSKNQWRIGVWQGGTFRIQDLNNNTRDVVFIEKGTSAQNNKHALYIDNYGYVGMGTNNPLGKLHPRGGPSLGDGYSKSMYLNHQGAILLAGSDIPSVDDPHFAIASNNNKLRFLGTTDEATESISISELMTIEHSGDVGIGTANPAHKLDVAGTVRAEELVLQVNNGPDYVFEEDYHLMPLEAVERHIKTNKHLPGVPKAIEMSQHGVGVAEMQMKLLEKVEELTLYLIDIKKENEVLKKQLELIKDTRQ